MADDRGVGWGIAYARGDGDDGEAFLSEGDGVLHGEHVERGLGDLVGGVAYVHVCVGLGDGAEG